MPQTVGYEHKTSDQLEFVGVAPDGTYRAIQTDDDGNMKAVLVEQAATDDDSSTSIPSQEVRNNRRQQFVTDYCVAELLREILLVLTEIRDNQQKG